MCFETIGEIESIESIAIGTSIKIGKVKFKIKQFLD